MKDFILDKDYILKDNRAWLEVDGFSIRIAKINSGLTIKVFKNGEESTTPIEEMFVDKSEVEENEDYWFNKDAPRNRRLKQAY